MDTVEMLLLFDYYGDMLTDRQRMCLDLRYNQDLSLAEIAEELRVSRQAVHNNIISAEAHLQKMEAKTGCVRRYLKVGWKRRSKAFVWRGLYPRREWRETPTKGSPCPSTPR